MISVYSDLTSNKKLNDYLDSLGVLIKHVKKDYLKINDIFVYPDIKDINNQDVIKKNNSTVSQILKKYDYIYFLGTEETGKTTLLKKIAKDYLDNNQKIILLNGSDIKTNKVENLIQKFYEKYSLETFGNLDDVILIIDDFSKQNIKDEILKNLLDDFCSRFKKVIIFIDKNSFIQNTPKYLNSHFNEVEILPFGHLKRHEIIKKWVTIGEDEATTISNEMYAKIDGLSSHFDIIMKKNIMDSRPIYIISIMQTLENLSMTNGNYSLTSYGQCYHVLIISMLNKANISMTQDLDGVMNFLSFLGYYFYNENIEEISEDDFSYLYEEYKKKFVPPSNIKKILLESGILASLDNDNLRFSQKYLFYFCCAKYISDNSEKMKSVITHLCQNIHNEKTANILIFLVHHLRGTSLLDEILTHTVCLLSNVKIFDMTAEANRNFKKILGEELQKIAFETKNIEEQRVELLKKKDQFETDVDSIELAMADHDISTKDLEETIEFSILQEATSALRSIEVLGQIAKNRHSSIGIEDLTSILSTTYDTGLKVLNFYLSFFKDSEDDLKLILKSLIMDENKNYSDQEAIKISEKLIYKLCFSICFYMIQLISKATAHLKLIEISDQLSNNIETPAYKLIHIYSRLSISPKIPKKHIKEMIRDNKKNPLVFSLLKNIIANHIYLHNLEYQDMQWIQSQFEISIDSQIIASKDNKMKLVV